MITLPFTSFVIGFVFLGLVFFALLWFIYDRRDRQYYDRVRLKHIHQCLKCNTVYTSREEKKLVACPECEFENAPLHF